MKIEPRIESIQEKKLVGKRLKMTFADDKTFQLWKSFMPRRKEFNNHLNSDLISLSVFDEPFRPGDLDQKFDKWAAIEVTDFSNIPSEMEIYVLKGGLYAVFHYKGPNTDPSIFFFIFNDWLPNSDYFLDARPHFEILGEKYKNNDPNSEEEIWIPIRPK